MSAFEHIKQRLVDIRHLGGSPETSKGLLEGLFLLANLMKQVFLQGLTLSAGHWEHSFEEQLELLEGEALAVLQHGELPE